MTEFTFRPAVRESIGLLVGIAGSTGSGKTFSALRLASGLAAGAPFAFIDSENGRALHYADQFDFHHGALEPPFTPERYAAAIRAADEAGYPVIVVDSASHEHAGEGGLLDMHEAELQRKAGDDWKRREQMSMAAWVKPKQAHKAFVYRMLQVRAHLIICLRAEEKVEMARGKGGKMEIRPKQSPIGLDGWMPVCEKNLAYEMTISVLMTADQPGMPKPIKLQEQHRVLMPLDQPVSEQVGEDLAKWALGSGDEMAERVAEASAALLVASDELGIRDSVTAEITKNRRLHGRDAAKHLSWLGRQQERLDVALAAREEQDVQTEDAA